MIQIFINADGFENVSPEKDLLAVTLSDKILQRTNGKTDNKIRIAPIGGQGNLLYIHSQDHLVQKGCLMRVLVADDSMVVRQRLTEMLEDIDSIEVIDQAGSIHESLNSFRANFPEVVILDIRLPDGSGIDALRSIKNERPGTIVIMLTNFPTSQYRRRCIDFGADFFFDKSTEYQEVRHVVEQQVITEEGTAGF